MRPGLLGTFVAAAFIAGTTPQAHATEIQRVSFSGSQAAVGFFGSTSVTCPDGAMGVVFAFGSLTGAQQIIASSGLPDIRSNGVFVEVDGYSNTCTGASLGFSEGGITGGFTPPDRHLTSAAIVCTTTIQDFGSGAVVSFSADVDVLGSGTTSTTKSNSHSKVVGSKTGPLQISMTHAQSSSRTADATGTILIEGVDINAQFFFAAMSSGDTASMSVAK
jgi:hypothetical protein